MQSTKLNPELSLPDLILARNAAVADQGLIKDRIKELSDQICAMVGVKVEGSISETVDTPMGTYRITTVGKLTRAVDPTAWVELESEIPTEWRSLVVQKPQLDLRRYRACCDFAPEVALQMERALKTKAATPSLRIEEIEE